MPVGSAGTTKSTGSNSSASWYRNIGGLAGNQQGPQGTTGGEGSHGQQPSAQNSYTLSSSRSDTIGSHTYVNFTELKRDRKHIIENQAAEVIHAVIHQESLEDEIPVPTGSPPYPPGEEMLPYPAYLQDNLNGDESPPLDCNKSLISSEPRHTM